MEEDPWDCFPYPNDLVCRRNESVGDCDCGEILVHGWSRSYDCPRCGTHYDYDPFYMAALCEINIDKYPELREKYQCPFTEEEIIKEIEEHKKRILMRRKA